MKETRKNAVGKVNHVVFLKASKNKKREKDKIYVTELYIRTKNYFILSKNMLMIRKERDILLDTIKVLRK